MKYTLLVIVFFSLMVSCIREKKHGRNNKNLNAVRDSSTLIVKTKVQKFESLSSIFNAICYDSIPGGRTSGIELDQYHRFSHSKEEQLWLNSLSNSSAVDGWLIASCIKINGKLKYNKVYEIVFQSPLIQVSNRIRIGANIDTVIMNLGKPFKFINLKTNTYAFFIDSNIIMTGRYTKNRLIDSISIGQYKFKKDTSELFISIFNYVKGRHDFFDDQKLSSEK